MTLVELLPCDDADAFVARQALASIIAADARPNATVEAIKAGLAVPGFPGRLIEQVPFSSERKWQGVTYSGDGSWVLGAPDVLLPPQSGGARQAEAIGRKGLRVLLLGKVDRLPQGGSMGPVAPQLLVVLDQRLRSDARETLEFFKAQGVEVMPDGWPRYCSST